MFPPNASGTMELRASPPIGATPMQPRKGCSGIFTLKLESKRLKRRGAVRVIDRIEPVFLGQSRNGSSPCISFRSTRQSTGPFRDS